MLRSKFIDIIKTFSKAELKSFRDFLASPYFNTNKNVIRLYEFIRKFAPDFSSDSISKESLYKKLYPGKGYNDTVMRILLSDLLKLAEEFMAAEISCANEYGKGVVLMNEFMNRGLDNLYMSSYKDLKNYVKGMEDRRTAYFNNYELELYNVDFHLRKDKQNLITSNVLERGESIMFFSLIEIARNVHDIVINERTFNAKFEKNLIYEFMKLFNFEEFLRKVQKQRPEHFPLISIYYNMVMAMLNEGNEKLYDEFKTTAVNYLFSIGRSEQHHFLHDLESCCLNNMKYNASKYNNELIEIYDLMLKTNTMTFTGTEFITAQRFKNILIGGLNSGRLDWTKEFVSNNLSKMQPEYRESMKRYSEALFCFLDKDFETSLLHLNSIKNDYFTLKMDIKSWTLKNYIELGYLDSAFSLIDTYRHFISKNKTISDYFRERHLNFIRYAYDVVRMKSGQSRSDAREIEKKLNGTDNVVHKDWLRVKLKGL